LALVAVYRDERVEMDILSYWEDHWIQQDFDHFIGLEMVFCCKEDMGSFSLLIHGKFVDPTLSDYWHNIWKEHIQEGKIINFSKSYAINGEEVEVVHTEGLVPLKRGKISIGKMGPISVLDENSIKFEIDEYAYPDLTKLIIHKRNGNFKASTLYVLRIGFLLTIRRLPGFLKWLRSLKPNVKEEIHILSLCELDEKTQNKLCDDPNITAINCINPVEGTCACQAFIYVPNGWNFKNFESPARVRDDMVIRKRNFPYTTHRFDDFSIKGKRLDYDPRRVGMISQLCIPRTIDLKELTNKTKKIEVISVPTLLTSNRVSPIYYTLLQWSTLKFLGVVGYSIAMSLLLDRFFGLDTIKMFFSIAIFIIIFSRLALHE